ncbi:MAG TPA: hypothetical protein VJ853_11650 [Thermoanaerobaculia bacterium]|nr:hypothetical protein [Thermoanaerobaculia bacterium]
MNDDCLHYAEDPEANAAHLASCESCRAAYGAVETHAIAVDALPLAPWEGASYRAWPLVLGGTLTVLAIALALCGMAGISPIVAVQAGMWPTGAQTAIAAIDQRLRPLGPFAFAALFLVVNSILFLLLRRAPRGIDA